MKRNLLAIAIPALLVAGAANASIEVFNKDGNKLSVNGRVYALNYIGDKDKTAYEGDKTTARLGFTGETQITEDLVGYGRAEWETKTGGASFKETRYAFAGLKFGNLGSIDYGRNDGVVKGLTAYTDVLPEFGGDAANNAAYSLSHRVDGALTYRNAGFFGLVDGLDFALQYADRANTYSDIKDASGDVIGRKIDSSAEAYGVSVDYAILDSGVSVAGAYARTGEDESKDTWAFGAKYDANDLYVAGLYIESKQDDVKLRGFEVVAQYGIDFEVGRLTPSVAYVQHKDKTSGASKDETKYVEIGAKYDFNKNLAAIVDYKLNLLDKEDNANDYKDTVALGLIYQF